MDLPDGNLAALADFFIRRALRPVAKGGEGVGAQLHKLFLGGFALGPVIGAKLPEQGIDRGRCG